MKKDEASRLIEDVVFGVKELAGGVREPRRVHSGLSV